MMVWGGICGQHRTDLFVIDANLTAHRYLHMVDIHAFKTFFCFWWLIFIHLRYEWSYMKSHILPLMLV